MSHMLVMIRGGYTEASVADEIWTVTQRFALVDGLVDQVGVLPTLVANANDTLVNDPLYVGNTNFNVQGTAGDFDPVDWLKNELYAAWTTLMTDFSLITDKAEINRMDAYLIGSDGKAQDLDSIPGTVAHAFLDLTEGTRPNGNVTGTFTPLQCGTVISWYTPLTTRKGRGRSYMPALGANNANGGVLPTARQQDAVDASAIFATDTQVTGLTSWNTRLSVIGGSPMVDYAVVTKARVGKIVDTQRRRRNQLNEAYLSVPIVV